MTTTRSRSRLAVAAGLITAALTLTACSTDESIAQDDPTSAPTSPGSDESTAPQSSYPVTVTSCGRESAYEQAPSRVVLGYPRTIETLEALGVADAAYGYVLGSYDTLPEGYPSDVVEVSPDYAPSREAVIGARPDLFLGNDEGQVTSDSGVSYDDLDKAGSATYILGGYCSGAPAPTSIDIVTDDITNLGKIFGVEDRAADVVGDLESRIEAAKALGEGQDLTVGYVQVFDGKLYAIAGYPASGVIEALGLTNEWGDIEENFAEISKEEALTRTPDVLLVNYVGADNADQAVADVEELLASTPAVQNGRVYAADETDFQAGGVSIVAALERAATDIFGP